MSAPKSRLNMPGTEAYLERVKKKQKRKKLKRTLLGESQQDYDQDIGLIKQEIKNERRLTAEEKRRKERMNGAR